MLSSSEPGYMLVSQLIVIVGIACSVGCTRVSASAHLQAAGPLTSRSSTNSTKVAAEAGSGAASEVGRSPSREIDQPADLSGSAMENSDACLQPTGVLGVEGLAVCETYVRRAVGFPPASDAIAAVMISPSFKAIRMLSLHRRSHGEFILRLTRVTEDIWAKMLREMEAQQGSTINLSDSHQAAALAHIAVATTILERTVDGETARMLEKLLSSLLVRAQLVREVGVVWFKADGTGYDFWQPGKEGETESPHSGSILGLAASAADKLCRLIESPSAGDEEEMAAAIARSVRNEPCLRPYHED